MALAANSANYLPPRNIKRMEEDLALLPLWWSEEGDYVLLSDDSLVYVTSGLLRRCVEAAHDHTSFDYADNVIPGHSIRSLSPKGATKCKSATGKYEFSIGTLSDVVVEPWGWSLQLRQRLLRLGVPSSQLLTPEQLDTYRTLSSRSFACDFIRDLFVIADQEGWGKHLVGRGMKTISSLPLGIGQRNMIFKSPWSSSGRGVIVARPDLPLDLRRLQTIIRDQGSILVDDFYSDKLLDFALEFEVKESLSTHKNCEGESELPFCEVVKDRYLSCEPLFRGVSVFSASSSGAYGYNFVENQASLHARILSTGFDEAVLDRTITTCANLLHRHLSGRYSGPVGIDMLICRHEGKILLHPCIEINLRRNMGILANDLYHRLGDSATSHLAGVPLIGFSAQVIDGKLQIVQHI